jgi:hypothetical protein
MMTMVMCCACRYFVLFLMYMWVTCVYGMLILVRPFISITYHGGTAHLPAVEGSLATVSLKCPD